MKSYLGLALVAAILLASCTTAYKTGQTPDDVYYSPARPGEEYVQVDKRDDRYYNADEYYEDRYIRMRMRDRYRWSALDDYYFNTPYAYHYTSFYGGWNNPWNSYWTWNSFYNPYYNNFYYPYYPHYGGIGSGVVVKNPVRLTRPSRPVAFNPNSYMRHATAPNGTAAKSYNQRYIGSYNNNNNARYNNSNSGSFNNSLKRVFSGNNSNSYQNNNTSTPTRTYNPGNNNSNSSSSGSRSSSSSSSSSGSTRPPR